MVFIRGNAAQFTAASTQTLSTSAFVGDVTSGSISLWVKRSGAQITYARIFSLSDTVGNEHTISYDGAGTALYANQWRVAPLTPTGNWNTNLWGTTDATWMHVVYSWGTDANGGERLYIDGSLYSQSGSDVTLTTVGNVLLQFGSGLAALYFNGWLDSVGIWGRVITAAEVTSIYKSGNGKAYEDLTNAETISLISWWNLNETSGTRYDSHGTNHLTANNAVSYAAGIVPDDELGACSCGYGVITETPSGGIGAGGSATVRPIYEKGSSGSKCSGSATVSTNQLWDGYALVFHLEESGNGTAGEYIEQVAGRNGQGGAGRVLNTPTQTQTIFDHGQTFDGNDYIVIPNDGSQAPYTISCWVRRESEFFPRWFYSRGKTASGEGWQIALGHNENFQAVGSVQVVGAASTFSPNTFTTASITTSSWQTYTVTSTTTLEDGCWFYLTLVFDTDTLSLYVDGGLEATTNVGYPLVPSTSGSFIGRLDNAAYIEGTIDELRVYAGTRNDEWIAAEYTNLCSAAAIDYGSQSTPNVTFID